MAEETNPATQKLVKAVTQGDVAAARAALAEGADIDVRIGYSPSSTNLYYTDEMQGSVLREAATQGDFAMYRLLVDYKPELAMRTDHSARVPLQIAANKAATSSTENREQFERIVKWQIHKNPKLANKAVLESLAVGIDLPAGEDNQGANRNDAKQYELLLFVLRANPTLALEKYDHDSTAVEYIIRTWRGRVSEKAAELLEEAASHVRAEREDLPPKISEMTWREKVGAALELAREPGVTWATRGRILNKLGHSFFHGRE